MLIKDFQRLCLKLFFRKDYPLLHRSVFGMEFPHPVGLASGFDPKGTRYSVLLDAGFAYVQCGPFYDKKDILAAIDNLKASRREGILAANIACQGVPSLSEDIVKAYSTDFSILYDFFDLFIFKIEDADTDMDPILDKRMSMDIYKPIIFFLSEDLNRDDIRDVLHYSLMSGIDGVIVGNDNYEKTLSLVKYATQILGGSIPVIASGGICTPEQVAELLGSGAEMVEIRGIGLLDSMTLLRKSLKHLNLQ